MKNKFFLITTCGVLCSIALTICCAPKPVFAINEPLVNAKSALLVDFNSGKILYEKNADEKLPVASMVKLMTTLLTYEEIDAKKLNLDTKVTITTNASNLGGSQAFLDPFVEYSVGELLHSVIIASANDSSVALAEHISGSEDAFVVAMNKRASELGMNDTCYSNATGLPEPGQYSTAKDCAKIIKEVSKHKDYFNHSTVWIDELVHPSGRKTELVNTNKLVRYFKGCDSGKTGFTDESGYCLTACAKRDNMHLTAVVINAKDAQTRFNETGKLFNFGFSNFVAKSVVGEKEIVANLPVIKSKIADVDICTQSSFSSLEKKGEASKFEKRITLPEKLKAPLAVGDKVGEIIITENGKIVATINLVVMENIDRLTYIGAVKEIISEFA